VPASVTFTPGRNPSGATNTNPYGSATPDGWIPLDGGHRLSNATTWQLVDTLFEIPAVGEYHLLFYWLNDASGGTQPPAAVDNISISPSGCPAVENLAAATTTSITLQWEAQPLAQEYLVEYGTAGFTPGTGIVETVAAVPQQASTVRHTLSNLVSATFYDIHVTTLCGEDWYADSTTSLLNVNTLGENLYTVTLLSNNEAFGTVAGGGTYPEGSVITLVATPTPHTPYPITLYPNPSSANVTIRCNPPTTIAIIDITGREVMNATLTTGITTIDVSTLAPGTYYVLPTNIPHHPAYKLIIN
jgi:hypothetical protein